MNQGKLEVVKQEMAKVNVDILGISELKWTGMGEFNSDDHYTYYCRQESLRRNGVATMAKRALISHASKVMLKVIQAGLQQYMNHELPDVQAGFRKGRGTRDQIAHICWIIEKAREFQKNIYFCFVDYTKAFDCVDHNKMWKILKVMGIPDHLTCLLINLCRSRSNS